MADKDQFNDEYQFDDLDAINSPDTGDDTLAADEGTVIPEDTTHVQLEKNNTKRNALIVIGAVILAILLYKIVGSMFSTKKVAVKTNIPALVPVAQPVVQPQVAATPVVVAAPVDMQLTQKIAVLESTQQTMRSDISSLNDQLNGINQNVNAIVAKMTELNSVILALNAKVDAQSREFELLTIRREQVKRIHPVIHKVRAFPKYYIQAVIPGRAWLIASNGATLTVREGTIIAGYGIVKLIDPTQGRVTTSSGQVIRFSQDDS
jgi:intracellular multiplication protein IcmG